MVVRVQVALAPYYAALRAVRRCLNPATIIACGLAVWRLGEDLEWTGRFAISGGLFSHWQVWLGIAVLLQVLDSMLQRFTRGGGADAS
jgi:hypothetical protein